MSRRSKGAPGTRPDRSGRSVVLPCGAGRKRKSSGDRRERGSGRPGVALDVGVVTSTAILTGLGAIMVYSTTGPLEMRSIVPPHFVRHLFAVGLALLCVAAALHIPLSFWKRIARPLWIVCVVLLGLTLFTGVEVKGSSRWLLVPFLGVRFQPAELVKLACVLAVAAALSRRQERDSLSKRKIQAAAALAAVPAALLLCQPDLGSAAMVIALVGALVYVAGAPITKLALPALFTSLATVLFVFFNAYARRRVTGFLDPWQRASNEGFQLVQSFVAFGRGGSTGVGFGDGRQKLGYLPEAHTDFILSALGEELGLVGVLVVLGSFAALTIAGLRIAGRARDPFVLLVACGMTMAIVVPAAVNAAVVMGVLPTTGFTLPFLSYGRVSVVTCGLAVGILLRIGAVEAAPAATKVASAARRRVART